VLDHPVKEKEALEEAKPKAKKKNKIRKVESLKWRPPYFVLEPMETFECNIEKPRLVRKIIIPITYVI